jgi:hypothetical protein
MNNFIPSVSFAPFKPLDSGAEQLRTTLLKLLLLEAEKSCVTRQRLDTIDRHMVALRQLIYRQVESVEKGHDAERALRLLETMNDLMVNYQTLRRTMGPAEGSPALENKNLRFHVAVQGRPLITTSPG